MRRALLALALLLVVGTDARALTDAVWNQKQHAANFPLDQLPAPSAAASPSTAPVRPIDLNPAGAPCILSAPGANGLPVCATPLASLSVTDPISSTGGASPTLGLKFTNVDLILTGPGALEVAAFTGAITKAAGATSTIFGSAGPHTVLANLTGGSAVPTFTGPATGGQFLGDSGWASVPTTSITGLAAIATSGSASDLIAGTVPAARVPAFVGAITTAGGTLTTAFGTQTGNSFFGVAGGSTAVPAPIVASVANTVPLYDGTSVAWRAVPVGALSGAYGANAGLGPTALGSNGAASTFARSDQKAPAYRSDLPLSTTWFIDPVNGSDAAANPGTASATALKTMQELSRRWWSAEIQSNTTVTILGNVPPGDVCAWNFTVRSGVVVTIVGSLGPTTGFGGAAIDNTVYAGSVTGFVAASGTPAADDIELTDSAIPVSYTASGVLANGIILKRTSSTALYWYALKDLGSKTLRITVPTLLIGQPMNTALSNGDAYSAYAMWQMPTQFFGAVAIQRVAIDSLFLNGAVANLTGTIAGARSSRIWYGMSTLQFSSAAATILNPMFGPSTSATIQNSSGFDVLIVGGGGRGNGTAQLIAEGAGTVVLSGSPVFQGMGLFSADGTTMIIENAIAVHDASVPCLRATSVATLAFGTSTVSGTGLSGKGNTGQLAQADLGSRITWGFSTAAPPFVAGSTSASPPITIGASTYSVAQLPAVEDTELSPLTKFPSTIFETGGPTRISWGAVSSGQCVALSGTVLQGQACANSITLTGPVTGTGTGTIATSINLGGGSISGTLALANEGAPTGTGFPHVTSGAWDSAARAVNLATGDVTGLLPVTSLSTGSSGQQLTMVGSTPTWVSPGSGSITLVGDVTGTGTGTITTTNANLPTAITQAGYVNITAIPAPATPASGHVDFYADSTSLNFAAKNASGVVNHGIQTNSGVSHEWISAIAADGSVTLSRPDYTDLTGTPTIYNQTIQANGTPQTQEPIFNFDANFSLSVGGGKNTISLGGPLSPSNTFGSAGQFIQAFTTDASGRVAGATPTNFPASTELLIAASGAAPVGDATLTYNTSTDILAAGAAAINGTSAPTNVMFIAGHTTNGNRDRAQWFLGGGGLPSTGTTGDSSLMEIFAASTAVSAGVTAGIYSTLRVDAATYTGTGQTITEATSLYIPADPTLSTVSGQVYAVHVAAGESRFDGPVDATSTFRLDGFAGSPAPIGVDITGAVIKEPPVQPPSFYYMESVGWAGSNNGGLPFTSDLTGNLTYNMPEVPIGFIASSAKLACDLQTNNINAGGSISFDLTLNGSLVSGSFFAWTSASSTGHYTAILSTGGASPSDTYSLHYQTGGVATSPTRFGCQLSFTP